MKFADWFKGKETTIIVGAAAINLALLYALGILFFELYTALGFLLIAWLVSRVAVSLKDPNALNLALLGLTIPIIYNLLGGWFFFFVTPTIMSLVVGGLQQGIITYLFAKLYGVK